MLEESIEELTKLMIKANFEKDKRKEALIRFCIKLLKVIKSYEWKRNSWLSLKDQKATRWDTNIKVEDKEQESANKRIKFITKFKDKV